MMNQDLVKFKSVTLMIEQDLIRPMYNIDD